MKVAVFSDVQANLPALEAAIDDIQSWRPDLIIMAGDLINRGPSSRACLQGFDALRRHDGWLPIKGNHEAWVLRCGQEPPDSTSDERLRAFTDWTYRQIADLDLQDMLEGWPDHLCFHGQDGCAWVHVTHGSLAGNRDGISASTRDEDLAEKLPAQTALFVTAHTHKPMVRRFGGTTIVNVGSVGSPFDGDPRGSYGRLELRGGEWAIDIRRFAYDRAQTERDFHETGFLREGGALAQVVFQEWRRAQLLMPHWMGRYREAVLNGEVSPDRAVAEFLSELD